MLPFVPKTCKTFLEVGCGEGHFGALLKDRSPCYVWGVDSNAQSIRSASEKLDNTSEGLFEPRLALPQRHFDCIIFNDVIEHVANPDSLLTYARELLTKRGYVIASIPNVGHFPTIWRLAIHGTWEYKQTGILDTTHLRFYTRKSIRHLFHNNHLTIETLSGINPYFCMDLGDGKLWRRYRLISWLKRPSVHDMRYLQFSVVARAN